MESHAACDLSTPEAFLRSLTPASLNISYHLLISWARDYIGWLLAVRGKCGRKCRYIDDLLPTPAWDRSSQGARDWSSMTGGQKP